MSNKVRISASINKELLKYLDKKIEKRKFANRSHGIEYCVQFTMNSDKE